MTDLKALQDAVIAHLDVQGMYDFLADIVNIPSPTGEELAVAEFIHQKLLSMGVKSNLQVFAPGRANVIARLEGTGEGPVLMLNGHIDTSYTGREPELTGRGYKTKAIVDGDWMYGNGVHNMKNAMAAYVYVVDAIIKSGVKLKGDVLIAAVGGEIEKSPYGAAQGEQYNGFGAGTGYALAHGVTADMCILGEPTTNTIGLSNLGVNWIKITTKGTMAHTQDGDKAVNAIDQMEKVTAKVRAWMADYRVRNEYKGIRPAADITAIEGGWPWRVSRTPVFCNLFLCVRTPPGVTTGKVTRELRALLNEVRQENPGLEVDLEVYVSHPAVAISEDEPVVRALDAAFRQVTGREPVYRPRGAYMDSSHLVAHGIPTVVYGASGRVNAPERPGWSPKEGEHTYLPDLLENAKVVAATAVDLCSRSASELGIK